MTNDTSGGGASGAQGGGAESGAGGASSITFDIRHQYIKDLSFEIPGAPGVFAKQSSPDVKVNVDVAADALDGNAYEVILKLDASGQSGDAPLFIVELSYAGLFHIADVPKEHMQPLLLIEAPRLLFPFARNIIAGVTRDGGLPPLMISPIDFVTMYRNRLSAQQGETAAPRNGESAGSA